MANILFDALFAPLAGRPQPLLHLPAGAALSGDGFLAMAQRSAAALRAAGVTPGDRVAVQVAKSPEALALYAGAVAAGAVFLPLNTAYTPAELGYFIDNAEPALVVADPAAEARVAAVAGRAPVLTLGADGRGSLADLAAAQAAGFAPVPRGPDDLAAILYTSGTTGRSKGAMLSHRNLLSNAEVLTQAWRFGPQDVLLHALPVFHTHGLFVATHVALLSGGSMIYLPGFEIEAVLRALPRATAMMGVPTFYTRLLDDARLTRDLVAGMRLFVSGSAPLLPETHRAFEARTGHCILERYGMTETSMITSNPYAGARRARWG
jgi:malonyl-CoA/methylmalonyl-CoA synthetase